VIVGKDMQLIEQILRVLTYFIRCSELAENTEMCPSLTADVDDTLTLVSTSDIATPAACLTADVTLSSSCSTSTGIKNVSPAEKQKSDASTDSSEFVLKPAPNVNDRGIRVRFDNGVDGALPSLVDAPSLTDRHQSNAAASDRSVCSHCTSTATEQSAPRVADSSSFLFEPRLLFRSDVSPSLLGVVCSGCSFIQPCDECRENTTDSSKLKNLSKRNGDVMPLVSMCNVSDVPSDCGTRVPVTTDREDNLPSRDSPKLCQLSPVDANENVRIERVPHVGREQVEKPKPDLYRVPLEKPGISSPCLPDSSTNLPVVTPEKHLPLKLSTVAWYERSNSMFDEYYDDSSSCPVIDFCSVVKSAVNSRHTDTSAFDEIMNESYEPCPDVSHIDVSHLSSSSSSSEVTAEQQLDSKVLTVFHPPSDGMVSPSSGERSAVPEPVKFNNTFDEQHFAPENSEQHLDDIPDGPSKQMISSAIKLMQDVCLDRTSQASADDDLADIPASDYFSQPGLGPSRGRQRHPSGQSNTSARCWYDHLTALS